MNPVDGLIALAALSVAFSSYMTWRAQKNVLTCMKLLASRSYVEFAKGEEILAKKGKAEEKKSHGDGYTSVFE